MAVGCEADPHERRLRVPDDEDADRRHADVGADHLGRTVRISSGNRESREESKNQTRTRAVSYQVAEEDPGINQGLAALPGRPPHDVLVCGVEAESRRRRPVGHQVDPEELHRYQAFGEAQRGGQEDGEDFSYVGRDHVPTMMFGQLVAR